MALDPVPMRSRVWRQRPNIYMSQQRRRCLPHSTALYHRSRVFGKKSAKEAAKKFGNGVGLGWIATWLQPDKTVNQIAVHHPTVTVSPLYHAYQCLCPVTPLEAR